MMAPDSLEALRQQAVDAVSALKRENAPRIGHRAWTSFTGYNYGRWADKGFNIVLGLLSETLPLPGETGPDFLRRIIDLARARRNQYRVDAADEDGACSGAIDAAMWKMIAVLPSPYPAADSGELVQADPDAEVGWRLRYTDMFDREMPPQVEAAGTSLIKGLEELWARFLFETVQADGSLGFSRFHIQSDRGEFEVDGDRNGMVRLREWVFGDVRHTIKGFRQEADEALLEQVATAHAARSADDPSGARILLAAAAASDKHAFLSRLKQLVDA